MAEITHKEVRCCLRPRVLILYATKTQAQAWPASYGGSAETYLRFCRYLFICLGGREDKRDNQTLFLCAQQSKQELTKETGPSELCLSTGRGKDTPKTSQTGQGAKFLLNKKNRKQGGQDSVSHLGFLYPSQALPLTLPNGHSTYLSPASWRGSQTPSLYLPHGHSTSLLCCQVEEAEWAEEEEAHPACQLISCPHGKTGRRPSGSIGWLC